MDRFFISLLTLVVFSMLLALPVVSKSNVDTFRAGAKILTQGIK